MRCILCFLIFAASLYQFAAAQEPVQVADKTNDTAAENHLQKKLFINPGFEYISNLTYAGRKNSVRTPVLTSYMNLILKKGFFLATTGYLNASKNDWGFEGASITPGYVFRLSKKFSGYISATKYLLTDSSSLILASMKGSVDGGLNFKPRLMNAGITFDYIFGSKPDLLTGINLSKDITTKIFKKVTLKITPTASFMAGTQSFYETYYTKSVKKWPTAGSSGASGPLGGILNGGQPNINDSSLVTSVVTEKKQKEMKDFRPLNVSFYLTVYIQVGKLQFDLTPNLVFPFNQVNLEDGSSSPELNKPFFFGSAGVSLIL